MSKVNNIIRFPKYASRRVMPEGGKAAVLTFPSGWPLIDYGKRTITPEGMPRMGAVVGYNFPAGFTATLPVIEPRRAARALSFWQERGNDGITDLAKMPFPSVMYYLHFYQGASDVRNWESTAAGVLALRLAKIFELDRKLAAKIFWSLPEHAGLPHQLRVMAKLAGQAYLQASLLTARGINMGHRLVEDMIWDKGVNWMEAARFLNADGLSAEEERILGEIRRRYLLYFGEDFTFRLKYSMNWYNRLDPVLRLENMIMVKEFSGGKRSAGEARDLQSRWSQLMPLLRQADPKIFVHALEGFSEEEQNLIFARMIEFGGIERVKRVLILVLNNTFALDNPDVAATGTESTDRLRSRLYDILNLIDDQPLRKQSRRLVAVFRDIIPHDETLSNRRVRADRIH